MCNDNADSYNYLPGQTADDRVAQVVCRQMGYNVGRLLERNIVPKGMYYGNDKIVLDDMQCTGNELHIEKCLHCTANPANYWLRAFTGDWSNCTSLDWIYVDRPDSYANWYALTGTCDNTKVIGVGCDAVTAESGEI